MTFNARHILLGGFALLAPSFAGAPAPATRAAMVEPAAEFPDGVSPSDVFATMDLVERTADVLLKSMGRRTPPPPKSFETSLMPMHVYQLAAAAANRVNKFAESKGATATGWITVAPKEYFPRDVKKLADAMLAELREVAPSMQVDAVPQKESEFSDKTPSDVYQVVLRVFVKASVLKGSAKITPNEVYAEMAANAAAARSIVKHIEGSFDENYPQPEPRRKPADVYDIAMTTRTQLKEVCIALGFPGVEASQVSNGYRVRPIDVFVQSQLIMADLNRIKLEIGMTAAAPKPQDVTGKTPTDVWGQVSLVNHLLSQLHQDKLAQVKE